jgi:branched-subunit amino acid aminotransferase/4-amino-4-deoxychorismate lyase
VYEVWRLVNGQIFEFDRHMARLSRGLSELRHHPASGVAARYDSRNRGAPHRRKRARRG